MIPLRWRTGEPRGQRLDPPLAPDHPLVGTPCPGCDAWFTGGDEMALVYVGPGDIDFTIKLAADGEWHTGAAVALHAKCAGLSECGIDHAQDCCAQHHTHATPHRRCLLR